MSTWNPPGPLPEESAFVVQARDSIPPRRTTTTATTSVRGEEEAGLELQQYHIQMSQGQVQLEEEEGRKER